MGDVDGDGRTDTFYVSVDFQDAGQRRFGVVTTGGARSEWAVGNASPVPPTIYGVADANEDGQAEVFVNAGRAAYVLTLRDCELQPYIEPDGAPFVRALGFTDTTGIGCIDADRDGQRDLVTLDRLYDPTGPKTEVRWRRTVIRLDRNQARNGATDSGTYVVGRDDAAIELLSKVTCGEDDFGDPLTDDGYYRQQVE